MMKNLMIGAAFAASLLAGAATAPAIAAPASPLDPGVYSPSTDAPMHLDARRVYKCTARSRSAYGYEISASLAVAKKGALVQCAVRTPRGQTCVITSCI
jgi:hypothetical protein